MRYYLQLQIPMRHRQFFIKISQNRDCIQTFCNDRRNPFHLHVVNGFYSILTYT